jgi:hypothetical protein
MPDTDMSAWTPGIIRRFRVLVDAGALGRGAAGQDADDDAMRLAAAVRDRDEPTVRSVHEVLTSLAFSGYAQWCEYDDDEWTKNCLSQVLDPGQSAYLVQVLDRPSEMDLQMALVTMEREYARAWRAAADAQAAAGADLNPVENTGNWAYSRTPGTRYYIFHEGEYLVALGQ